ncbi:MAG: flavin reductase family protein [Burkholderiaceae bacterium]
MNQLPNPTAASVAGSPVRDSRALRVALGQFATGVTVITTRAADGSFIGLTANSFGALSLDPPLISWALRLSSSSLPVFRQSAHFVVNVLTESQVEVSRLFASGAPDKFGQVAHAENQHGMPYLHGAAAWFECRRVSQQDAGDHCLFIAEVERYSHAETAPLLFHSGGYFTLGSRL